MPNNLRIKSVEKVIGSGGAGGLLHMAHPIEIDDDTHVMVCASAGMFNMENAFVVYYVGSEPDDYEIIGNGKLAENLINTTTFAYCDMGDGIEDILLASSINSAGGGIAPVLRAKMVSDNDDSDVAVLGLYGGGDSRQFDAELHKVCIIASDDYQKATYDMYLVRNGMIMTMASSVKFDSIDEVISGIIFSHAKHYMGLDGVEITDE